MLEYLLLALALLRATVCDRGDLVAENLLLRHQLAVLARPTRKRPRLRAGDKLVWVLARLLRRGWRRHLVVVTPDRSSGGTAAGGACSRGGGRALGWAVRASAPGSGG
jgi:hypothetical protein